MISDTEELKDTVLWWLPPTGNHGLTIYHLVLGMILAGIISLFVIRVDLLVRARGSIGPMMERAEIRSPAGGLIDSIFFREGDTVSKNSILLVLRDPDLIEKRQMNESAITRCFDCIHDLERLCYSSEKNQERILSEKRAEVKVIAPQERYEIQEIKDVCETFRQEQLAAWQIDLAKYHTELKQQLALREELNQLAEKNRIRASISGCLREDHCLYSGSTLQAGEMICSIRPGGELMGECYVSTKDIGLLRVGQPARLQIDAFNENFFGVVTASIYAIDDDFILLDQRPVFKVKCRLHDRTLKLANGFSGELRKGMSFQIRFITANRSLWQLLFDDLNDWLNPAR